MPLLTQLMTPDLVAKMASAAGISDAASARKTISGAVPAILAELVDLVSKPEGARHLSDAVAKQPGDMLENLADTGRAVGQLMNIGKGTLTSLFDANTLGSLTSALSRYGGVGEGAVQSLLAMLTPMVLGVLARQAGAGARRGAATDFSQGQDCRRHTTGTVRSTEVARHCREEHRRERSRSGPLRR
jgi:hypothetical protein